MKLTKVDPPWTSTADTLEKWMNAHFEIGESTKSHKAITGEPYVVLCIGGPKPEGGAWNPEYYAETHKLAAEKTKQAFKEYIEDKSKDSKLYWRQTPELYEYDDHFHYYCRLLVSNKEVGNEQIRH